RRRLQRCPIDVGGIEIRRTEEDGQPRKVSSLLVVAEEKENAILLDRSSNSAAELMSNVFRFDSDTLCHTVFEDRLERERIPRSPVVIPLKIEQVAMEFVGS